jgi:hypothetical protein
MYMGHQLHVDSGSPREPELELERRFDRYLIACGRSEWVHVDFELWIVVWTVFRHSVSIERSLLGHDLFLLCDLDRFYPNRNRCVSKPFVHFAIGGDMKKTGFMLCFLFLISGVVFAQQSAKSPKSPKASFTLGISADHETAAPNSKVIVTVHLTNQSDGPLSFPWSGFGGPDPSYRVEVRNSQGQLAPYTEEHGKRMRREPPYDHIIGRSVGYTVEKGETATEQIEITKQYALSAPGEYTVRVFHPDPVTNADVQSNVITLTVRE